MVTKATANPVVVGSPNDPNQWTGNESELSEDGMPDDLAQAAVESDEPAEDRPAYVIEHESYLETLKIEIGQAAIVNAERAAAAKVAKRNMDDLIETFASVKARGPIPPEPVTPDPQGALPLKFDPFDVDVDDLELTEALTDALHQADYDTIGKLQAKMQACPQDWFEGIPKLGRAKATIVENSVGEWIEANRGEPEGDEDDMGNVNPLGGPVEPIGAVPTSVSFTGPQLSDLADAAEEFIGGPAGGNLPGRKSRRAKA